MKVKLVLLFLLLSFGAHAQKGQEKWHVELRWNPLNTGLNYVGIDKVGVRYTIGDRLNLRMFLQYNTDKKHKDLTQIPNKETYFGYFLSEYTNKESNYAIMPGIDYVFLNNSKVSPYIGLELIFEKRKTGAEVYNLQKGYILGHNPDGGWTMGNGTQTSNYTATGAQYVEDVYFNENSYSYSYSWQNPSHELWGVQIPLGFNVYVFKNFYLGLEIKCYYHKTITDKVRLKGSEVTSLDGSNKSVKQTIDEISVGKKIRSFGISYDNAIKIGVRF